MTPEERLAYLQAEAKRIGLPDDRIHCLVTIDAFPANEAPVFATVADLGRMSITSVYSDRYDEFIDPEQRWVGYHYEAIGCLTSDHPLSVKVRAVTLGMVMFGGLRSDDVEPWRQRVRAPGTNLYAEQQWRPGYDHPEDFIGGWSAEPPKGTEITLARRALSLIGVITARRGRRAGSDRDPEPDFPEQYASTYWELLGKFGHRPGQQEIAAELGINKATLKRRRDLYGVSRIPPKPRPS